LNESKGLSFVGLVCALSVVFIFVFVWSCRRLYLNATASFSTVEKKSQLLKGNLALNSIPSFFGASLRFTQMFQTTRTYA